MKKTLLCFLLLFTSIFYAQVTSITTCGDVPFNLTNLKTDFIGNLDPAETSVSYFLSLDDALNNTNVITNPTTYIGVAGISKIYGRIDNNGTITTNYFNLTIFKPLTVTASSQPIVCKGNTTSLTVNVSGEYSSYQYSINGGPFTSNNYYNNLPAGVYTIKVQSPDNVCPDVTISHTITEPNALLATSAIVNQNIIITTATGGTGPYIYSLDGVTFQNNNVFPNINPGSYTVRVRDAAGCRTVVQVNVLPPLNAAVAIVKELDCTNSGAVLNIIGVGGQAPYVYSIDNGYTYQGFNFFNNVNAGIYFVIVKDAVNSVSNPYRLVISPPAPVTGTTLVTNATSCSGASITVQATGGQAPYYYSIDNGATYTNSNVFNNLSPGNYSIVIKDSKGCVSAALFNTVAPQPAVLTGTADITKPLGCEGYATIEVTGTGGTPPYQYSTNNSIYSSTNIFHEFAGSHTIAIKDASGCTYTQTLTVAAPSPLLSVPLVTSPHCYGNADGSITVIANGGTPPYYYSINDVYQGGSVFTNLASGNYLVKVKDALGCLYFTNATIDSPTALNINTVITNTSCYDASDGIINITASGGTAPYTYSLNGGSYLQSNVFDNLSAGHYDLQIRDAQGCVASYAATIAKPDLLVLNVDVKTLNNDGNIGGKITLSSSGGNAPYKYSLKNNSTGVVMSDYSTIVNYSGMKAGTYTITVMDANGCKSENNNVEVTLQSPIELNTIKVPLSCHENASLNIYPSGGVAPYLYSKDGLNYTSDNSGYTNLTAPGLYSLLVKDAIGNSAQAHLIIKPLVPITFTATVSYETNNGWLAGVVTVASAGGTAPYTYTFKKGSGEIMFEDHTSTIYSGLPAGTYFVSSKDANGCESEAKEITIVYPTPILVNVVSTPLTCTNTTAAVTINVSGGTAPYLYSNDSGRTYSTTQTFNLAAGTYSVYAKDAVGNIGWKSYTIKPYAALAVTSINTNISCFGTLSGIINATATGGVAPYTYSIGSGYTTSNVFSNLSARTYTLSVKDAVGCTTTSSVIISQPNLLSITNGTTNSTTANSNDGTITIVANGGTVPYKYALKAENGTVLVAPQNSRIFGALPIGTYIIEVSDAKGCIASKTGITIASATLFGTLTTTPVSCNSLGTITINAAGGKLPHQYSFDGGTTYVFSNKASNLTAGFYAIKVKDAAGAILSLSTTVAALNPFRTTIAISSTIKCNGGSDGGVQVTASGGKAPYSYSINGGVYQSSNIFSNLSAGNYTINTKDSNDCSSTMVLNVAEPALLSSTVEITNNNITVNATGGKAPYMYTLLNSSGTTVIANQTSKVFTNVPSGTYTAKVVDLNNCTVLQAGINIIQIPLLTATYTASEATCSTGGTLTISATGGISPYLYSSDGGLTYRNTNLFLNLSPGNYNLTVKDAQNNTTSIAAIITAPSPIILSAAVTKTIDCISNAIINLNVFGGEAPYQFSINGGVFQSSNTFSGLAAGSYIVTARDANDCTSITNTIKIDPLAPLTLTSTIMQTTTPTSNDGRITLNTNGGTAPYSYSLKNQSGIQLVPLQSANIFNNLANGTYIVEVRDSKGCISSRTESITSSAPVLSAVATITPLTCSNPTGVITVNTLGGTAPYQYSFDNGTTFNSSNTFTYSTPGNYAIVVRDAQNATASTSVTAVPVSSPEITVTHTNISCSYNSDATITVSGTGGKAPYLYSINNTVYQNSNTFSGLQAGVYNVSIKDANNCMSNVFVAIDTPTPITAAATIENQTITVNAAGGSGIYMYSLDDTSYQLSTIFTNVAFGSYTIFIKDSNECTAYQLAVVVNPPAPIAEEGKNEIVYEYKPGQTLGDIVIEGENIKWYSSQNSPTSKTAETVLPLTTVLVNGVTYYASQTVNGIESKDRLAVTAKLNGSLSTPDFDLAGFKFYPNPVKNILTVNNTSVIDEVQIISISGESVLLKKINNTHSEIDLSNLSTGVYILKVKADGKLKATKFIKE